MSEELTGVFEDSFDDKAVEDQVESEGWNMDAVDEFRQREQQLADAEAAGMPIQPTSEESSFADINGTSIQVAAPQQTPTETAPQDGRTWAQRAIENEPGTLINPIPALSQVQDLPFVGELAAYAAIRASKPAEMDLGEWYDTVQKKMALYNAENPILAPVTSAATSLPASIMAGYAAPVLQTAAAASPVLAGAIGAGSTASQQPQYDESQRELAPRVGRGVSGAAIGGLAGYGFKEALPTLSPGAQQFVSQPEPSILGSNRIFKYFTKGVQNKMGQEASTAVEDLKINPNRFDDIRDVVQTRTELVNEAQDIIDDISKRGAKYDTSINKASDNFREAVTALEKRAEELRMPTDEVYGNILDMHDNMVDFVIQKYNDGYKHLPSREVYVSSPESSGFPLSKMISDLDSVKPDYQGKIGTRAPILRDVANEVSGDIQTLKDDALTKALEITGLNDAYAFVKQNPDILDIEKRSGVISGAIEKVRKLRQEAAANLVTLPSESLREPPISEIKELLRFYDNVSPEFVRDKLSDLFSGFKIERNAQKTTAQMIRESVQGQQAYSEAHTKLRGDLADHYKNDLFNQITKEANLINTKYILPLRNRVPKNELYKDKTVNAFKRAIKENIDQVRTAFRFAVDNKLADENLLKYADAVRAESVMKKDLALKNSTFDSVVEDVASKKIAAMRFMESLGKSDPQFKALLDDSVKSAEDLLASREEFNSVIKDAKGLFPDLVKRFGEKSIDKGRQLIERLTPSGKLGVDLGRIRSESAQGLEDLYTYKLGGDKDALSSAIDKVKRLRQIEAINADTGAKPSAKGEGALIASSTAMAGRAGYAAARTLAWMVSKFSKEYTNGKWTNANVYIIEKALQKSVQKRVAEKMNPGWSIIGGISGLAATKSLLSSQEKLELVNIIKNDKALNSKEKLDAIKNINENDISIEVNNGQ